jgi:hypothetical protein
VAPLKRDHLEIRSRLADLKGKYAGEARWWWPRFVFHYTNLQNAVSILHSGALFSRTEALRQGVMSSDNASPDVIQHTEPRWKDSVRLYFRPRTPTQYNNEGIRPVHQRSLDSHCPVPVFLLFDSLDILTRQSTLFSDRSLAKAAVGVGDSAVEFLKLPFQKIYHNTWFEPDQHDEIVACRHAEVIVPRSLDLDALK